MNFTKKTIQINEYKSKKKWVIIFYDIITELSMSILTTCYLFQFQTNSGLKNLSTLKIVQYEKCDWRFDNQWLNYVKREKIKPLILDQSILTINLMEKTKMSACNLVDTSLKISFIIWYSQILITIANRSSICIKNLIKNQQILNSRYNQSDFLILICRANKTLLTGLNKS